MFQEKRGFLVMEKRLRQNKFLVDIGDGNAVQRPAVLAVLDAYSGPVKKYVAYKNQRGEVIDATKGKAVKSVLVMLNGYLVLSNQLHIEVIKNVNGG